jgi:hypothetical protein
MNKRPVIMWACVLVFGMFSLYCAIRADMERKGPMKPEIETVVVETNVNATIITWTKTENGRKMTWGFVQINGKTALIFPFAE